MPVELRFFCPQCEAYNRLRDLQDKTAVACIQCGKTFALQWPGDLRQEGRLKACLFCGKEYFYRRRDFNKGIGCAILLTAVVLSFWTYGISLIVAWMIDWFLFKRLPQLTVCYVCETEYKGVQADAPEFDLHLHEKYKKIRGTDRFIPMN